MGPYSELSVSPFFASALLSSGDPLSSWYGLWTLTKWVSGQEVAGALILLASLAFIVWVFGGFGSPEPDWNSPDLGSNQLERASASRTLDTPDFPESEEPPPESFDDDDAEPDDRANQVKSSVRAVDATDSSAWQGSPRESVDRAATAPDDRSNKMEPSTHASSPRAARSFHESIREVRVDSFRWRKTWVVQFGSSRHEYLLRWAEPSDRVDCRDQLSDRLVLSLQRGTSGDAELFDADGTAIAKVTRLGFGTGRVSTVGISGQRECVYQVENPSWAKFQTLPRLRPRTGVRWSVMSGSRRIAQLSLVRGAISVRISPARAIDADRDLINAVTLHLAVGWT